MLPIRPVCSVTTPPGSYNPNARDKHGGTALHTAVIHIDGFDSYGIVNELLLHGADVNATDNMGVTPLTLAAISGGEAIVERLIEAGADPNQKRAEGMSLLMLAELRGNSGAAAAIRKAGGVYGSG